ncbi:MAG: D-alanyl-D-alanine carboxypeptidase [Christensenellaceae bacterium]|jgi:D-alanyl-D-alanine carboxypeptidase (penicillin-binding protein 5/6)|nr:D-alanyl-D-alanine carboxypeptidase [Christensenellaceae bacterium]
MKKKIFMPLSVMGLACLVSFCPNCENCECEKEPVAFMIQNENEEEMLSASKAAFLLEANSGEVLFSKDELKHLPVASMTKIATLAVIYDALANNEIKMDDKVLVSANASGMGGSQAFLDMNSEYSVADLIKSIVIASANDSCVAMAEKLYGSETQFVNKMNDLARKLGCENTNFKNCTGLPAIGAYSCAKDMAVIYQYIMKSPHYGDFNKTWMYDLTHPSGRITGLTNTNKLVRFYNGCDGGKTGFTTEAGHCITVTSTRGDLKPIAVIIGAANSKTRFAEASKLMNYTFDNYENKLLIDAAKPIGQIKVNGAVENKHKVYPAQNYYKLLKKGGAENPEIVINMPKDVSAPINGKIGEILVDNNTVDIIIGDIKKQNYFEILQKIAKKYKI